MAYMSQTKKAEIAPVVKAILKKYKLKGSLGVRNHSTLVLNIKSGSIDFIANSNKLAVERAHTPGGRVHLAENYMDVNPYWFQEHFDGVAKDCLTELFAAMNSGNWDKSDIQSDYFNVGWYVDVNVGKWDKAYELVA